MTKRYPDPVDASRGEIFTALVWICLGSIFSVILEVVYLGTRISIDDKNIPVPYMIIIAWWFNSVLSKTILLWTRNIVIVSIPLGVWILGYLALTFGPASHGAILVSSTVWSILLLLSGMAGGYWPLIRSLYEHNSTHVSPTNTSEE